MNHVSSTSGSRSSSVASHSAHASGGGHVHVRMAVRARPDRDLVAPPELPGDAPVGRLLERLDREPVLARGVVAHTPLAQRLESGRASSSMRTTTAARRAARSASGTARRCRRRGGTARAPSSPRSSAQATTARRVFLVEALKAPRRHAPVGPDHGQRLEPVVAADLEVGRVVPRRDLERARPELRVDALVGDHRHAALDDRHDDLAADRVAVALVVGVHRHRDVGEDRRRPHRRDRDCRRPRRRTGTHGVEQRVVHLDVLDLEVRDRRSGGTGTS